MRCFFNARGDEMEGIKAVIELVDKMSPDLSVIQAKAEKAAGVFNKIKGTIMGIPDVSVNGMDKLSGDMDEADYSIRKTTEDIQALNGKLNAGGGVAEKLAGKLAALTAGAIGLRGIKDTLELSDNVISMNARVNFMVDEGETQDELKKKLYSSAMRSRADYMETANAAANLKANAGNAFKDNDEVISFLEAMNKQFVIGGADAQTQAGAMRQLSQAMAAGALRGDELNSVLEGASQVARIIEKSMGWAEGSIKSYAEQGLVTAQVVKNAMLGSLNATNEQFEKMPMTFGQAMTLLKNKAVVAFEPVLDKVNELVNNDRFVTAADNILNFTAYLSGAVIEGIDKISGAITFMVDNWGKISPVVYGAAGALAGFMVWTQLANAAMIIFGTTTEISLAGIAASIRGLGIAMLTSPATWFALTVMAIGAAFGILAKKVGGADIALEIVKASIEDMWQKADYYAGAVVQGILTTLAQLKYHTQMEMQGIKDTFVNVKTFALVTFNNMVDSIAKLLNKVFGTAYDANITVVKNAGIQAARDANIKESAEKQAEFKAELDKVANGYQLITNEKAAKYNEDSQAREDKINKIYYERNFGDEEDKLNLPEQYNISDYKMPQNEMAGIADNVENIALNTEEIKNNADIQELIRDYHSMQATKGNTTQYVTVDLSGQVNNIGSSMELAEVTDSITSAIANGLAEASEAAPAGA